MKKNKLLVLCATQRCGSTMIVEDTRNTKIMGKAEEYFIPWHPDKDEDWLESFQSILKRSQTSNGVSAIKVMANQLKHIEACLENTELIPETHGMFPYLRKLFSEAIFVYIKRSGIVRQAVSRIIAKNTGVNHSLHDNNVDYSPGNLLQNDEASYNEGIKFSYKEIDAEVINIVRESLLWDEVLKSWSVNSPLALHYEQVCKSYPYYLNRIADYMDLEFDTVNMPTERNLKKISNTKNEELIFNYLGL